MAGTPRYPTHGRTTRILRVLRDEKAKVNTKGGSYQGMGGRRDLVTVDGGAAVVLLAPVSNRRESDRPRAPDFLQPRPPRTNEAPQAHRKPQYALPPSFGHGGNLLRDRGGLHGASPHLGYK
jgi:hypothetical protein